MDNEDTEFIYQFETTLTRLYDSTNKNMIEQRKNLDNFIKEGVKNEL